MQADVTEIVLYLLPLAAVVILIALAVMIRSERQEERRLHRQRYEETRVKPYKPRP